MPDVEHFDVAVIGGGSGLSAAYHAHQAGKRVALIEARSHALGGTCVNRGCIPSKALIQSAEVMKTIREAEAFGLTLDQSSVRVHFDRIMQRMREQRADNAAGAKQWVDEALTPFYSHARFIDDKLLETDDGQRITADKFFIASGARPAVPPIDGLEEVGYWTNEDVLELTTQPRRLVILGGGYIGAELGHFFATLGTEVTIVDSGRTLLSEDHEVSELFTQEFGRKVWLCMDSRAERAVREGAGKGLEITQGENGETTTVLADELLIAAGRKPNSDALDLDKTGVELDDKGWIRIDEALRTSHPDIYAYGDIIGQAMFKHTSSYEGELAYRNSQGSNEAVSYRANPHAVFSDPQVGAVGLTEHECQQQGLRYRVAKKAYADVAKGKIVGAPPGFAKLLMEEGSERILGFHMIGPQAADLVHEVAVAMNAGDASAALIRNTIHIHPTLSELVRGVFDELG
ncbi:dihydrolipoamide dehydrogenase [Modicisalibacter muralis]|uniref:Dihydrolipoamide dehydrogenase n=1 Tax=Modicisalibacter muralis TaxID=119000 RepID=A0A1G9QYR4_9GAMM|nr:dihydrolipoyl dehydrogenase [Halomonas muralis]SDM16114.1 dihydrolipoamide dehydrogenase [Halomonas muralis]